MRLRRGDAAMSQFRGMHELVEGMDLLDWYRCGCDLCLGFFAFVGAEGCLKAIAFVSKAVE